MQYIWYPVLLFLLLFGVKIEKPKQFNEEYMSLSQTKSILGFLAVCILFHHISQQTSAPWLAASLRTPGLEPFVYSGYLFVSGFFFCSGYGLYKSFTEKPDYLEKFPSRRILPVAVVFLITNIFFLIAREIAGNFALPASPFSWYIYAILIFYTGFYFIFRYIKKYPLLFMSLLVLAYCAVCYLLILGDWWLNTAPVFLLGMFFCKREKQSAAFIRKLYIPVLLVLIAFTAVFFHYSKDTETLLVLFRGTVPYASCNILKIALQVFAGCTFALLIPVISMKVRFGNKALRFLGGITLDLYLIQGLFVNMFSFCFIDNNVAPLLYIKNATLYTLTVTVLSVASAFGLHKLCGLITGWLKTSLLAETFFSVLKKILKIAVIAVLAVTVTVCAVSHIKSAGMNKTLEAFQKENLQKSGPVAFRSFGEGKETILLLGTDEEYCSTVALAPLARELASDYRVLVPDLPGTGFSDTVSSQRTARNIADELNTALEKSGEQGPFILVADQCAYAYAFTLASRHPSMVKCVIGIDPVLPQFTDKIMEYSGRWNAAEYVFYAQREALLRSIWQRILSATGYARWACASLQQMYRNTDMTEDELHILEEMYVRKAYTKSIREAVGLRYSSLSVIKGVSLFRSVPLVILMDNSLAGREYMGMRWKDEYEKSFTAGTKHDLRVIAGNSYVIYWNPKAVSNTIKDCLG